ncbi:MAG: S-layer homology domain-containing protein, partial [Actinomycetota bacterium]
CILGSGSSSQHSFADDASCQFGGEGDTEATGDAKLGPARHNGLADGSRGPLTHFPLLGSPLIDAIDAADCSAASILAADQRGIPRPFGSGCDIGAIEAVFPAHDRTDSTPFYEPTIRWVTSNVNQPQILSGYDDGTFGLGIDISRGQVARLYYRSAGAPDVSGLPPHGFSDVSPFFEAAVRWSKANGVFDGFPDGTFREGLPITRGNFIRSMHGYAGAVDVTGFPAHGFGDVTPYYEESVTWAKANDLADGFGDGTIRLFININRANASRISYNLAQTEAAWFDTMDAPDAMLFRPNA